MKIDGLHFSFVGVIVGVAVAEYMRRKKGA